MLLDLVFHACSCGVSCIACLTMTWVLAVRYFFKWLWAVLRWHLCCFSCGSGQVCGELALSSNVVLVPCDMVYLWVCIVFSLLFARAGSMSLALKQFGFFLLAFLLVV